MTMRLVFKNPENKQSKLKHAISGEEKKEKPKEFGYYGETIKAIF